MTQGIEFLELIYGQLHEAGIVRSKGEFSERLLGKSPSYLTSMRAKQRIVSSKIIVSMGDVVFAEIDAVGSDPHTAEIRSVLRRTLAQINNYLADQTIPAELLSQVDSPEILPPPGRFAIIFRMLASLTA